MGLDPKYQNIQALGEQKIQFEKKKDNCYDFPIQQEAQSEFETENGKLQTLRTLESTSAYGCPSLKCQSLKLETP